MISAGEDIRSTCLVLLSIGGSQRRSILREVYNPKDKEEERNVPLEEKKSESNLTSHPKAQERISSIQRIYGVAS